MFPPVSFFLPLLNNSILASQFYNSFPTTLRISRAGALSFINCWNSICALKVLQLYLYNFDCDQGKMNFRFSLARFCLFSATIWLGEKVLWRCVRRRQGTAAIARWPGSSPGPPFPPPSGVNLSGLSLSICKAGQWKAITTLISVSPKQHNLVLGKLIPPGPVQPTYFPAVKSLTVTWDQCHHGDYGIPALFNPGPLGKLQWDRKFKEGSGDGRGLGKGQGQNTAAHLALQQVGTETRCAGSYEEGDRKPENRELSYHWSFQRHLRPAHISFQPWLHT